jgi:hypothetical protein
MHTATSHPKPAALACTKRETARLLRIDRGATLDELIARKLLIPIPWGKGWRIPLEQIQHLARTGYTVNGRPSRAVSRPRHAGPPRGAGDRIRALEVTP